MSVILQPHEIAEKCFLIEALYWLAFNRYPLEFLDHKGERIRSSYEHIMDLETIVPEYDSYILPEETARIGILPDPHYKEAIDEDVLEAEFEEWERVFSDFLEIYKTKFYVALREGQINSYAKKLPFSSMPEAKDALFNDESFDLLDMEDIKIPCESWRLEKINWDGGYLEAGENVYALISFVTQDVLKAFPALDTKVSEGVMYVSGQYVLEEDCVNIPDLKTKRGRPSFSWEDFYAEVAIRLRDDLIPCKQEAFIVEMQEWCFNNWGRRVARSTILEKVSPLHNRAFPKKS